MKKNIVALLAMAVLVPGLAFADTTHTGHTGKAGYKNSAEYKRLHPAHSVNPGAPKGAKTVHAAATTGTEGQQLHRTKADYKDSGEYKRLHPTRSVNAGAAKGGQNTTGGKTGGTGGTKKTP